MICVLGKDDWCERHQRFHRGPLRELALRDDAEGEHHRRIWDQRANGPGLLKQAANFAGAVVKHVVGGLTLLTAAQSDARLAVCRACDLYTPETAQCRHGACGCYLPAKVGWAEQHCPLEKWPGEQRSLPS